MAVVESHARVLIFAENIAADIKREEGTRHQHRRDV